MTGALRAGARDLAACPPRLRVATEALPADRAADLLALLHGRRDVVAWVRHGRGLVGWGRVLTLEAEGAGRIEELRAAWRAVVYASWWTDPLVRPGTGPVALGAIAFSASSRERSVLVVPEVIVGADASGAWVTTASLADRPSQSPPAPARVGTGPPPRRNRPQPASEPVRPRASVRRGALADDAYLAAVATTQRRMAAGEARKVVLARDVMVTPSAPLPVPQILARLARGYPSCWTFAVDGMVGASPELLVRLEGRRLACRVLAGTARRRTGEGARGPADPAGLAEWLEASGKNNREHELARASALAALEPLCSVVEAPERFVVTLPNVLHLASDITGVVAGDTGALSLVGALHPTAAVCGTPTPAAARIIEEVEGMDRGRYAGPVGWLDQDGDGEIALALRCGQQVPGGVRLQAGGGMVPGAVPEEEVTEIRAKFLPMRRALGVAED